MWDRAAGGRHLGSGRQQNHSFGVFLRHEAMTIGVHAKIRVLAWAP